MPRPRIMAASASAAGYWAMFGALFPLVSAPASRGAVAAGAVEPVEVAPRADLGLPGGRIGQLLGHEVGDRVHVGVAQHAGERRHADAALRDHGADQAGKACRRERRADETLTPRPVAPGAVLRVHPAAGAGRVGRRRRRRGRSRRRRERSGALRGGHAGGGRRQRSRREAGQHGQCEGAGDAADPRPALATAPSRGLHARSAHSRTPVVDLRRPRRLRSRGDELHCTRRHEPSGLILIVLYHACVPA